MVVVGWRVVVVTVAVGSHPLYLSSGVMCVVVVAAVQSVARSAAAGVWPPAAATMSILYEGVEMVHDSGPQAEAAEYEIHRTVGAVTPL